MNQNEYFMYHPDKTTRLIYADYLESRGDLFLASVLREEENVPIICEFKGEGCGDGRGNGNGFGYGWGSGGGDGNGFGYGNGYGGGYGYGGGDGRGNGWGDDEWGIG
jgi:uncharacterized protein (TIGR02996 family)